MNELQKRFPELYARLYPEGRFQDFYRQKAELRAILPQLSYDERWERLFAEQESEAYKEWITYRMKIMNEILSSDNHDEKRQLNAFIKLEAELSKDTLALFDKKGNPDHFVQSMGGYPDQIAGYVLQTIGLYCDAVSPQKLKAIRLCFDTSLSLDEDKTYDGEMQPTIDLTFDRDTYHIDVGASWNAPIELERDGRKNAQIWAESVWPEYLRETSPSPKEIRQDGEDVRQTVAKQYPDIPVMVEFHEAKGE